MKDYRKVLIAASERSTRQEILDHLSVQGYQVIAVERGGDALLAVTEGNISLAILDISVQEPSGAKTVEILRKMRPRLPVIVISGDPSVEAGRQILQHGVFYYFLKPLDLDELDQIVRIALASTNRLKAGRGQGAPKTPLGDEKGPVA